ncbi:MAG TPA: DUF4097 family beta strand repeat-containing protein [Pyrinomonadaceae bacterium]|jgi:DUF4097 and DUF4098 domain-containing protein YvlB
MNIRPSVTRKATLTARAILVTVAFALLAFSLPPEVSAQKKITRKYPARKNVRLELRNLSGSITIESWERNEILVTASMYSPTAQFTPAEGDGRLEIDVVRENRGRMVGDVNFNIKVPVNSTLDIETKRGNITINSIRGTSVRARVSTSGDIELTDIRASEVIAENGLGNLIFDGQLVSGGSYVFKTLSGDINIRIPGDSAFSLMAAGQAKGINLNSFANPGLSFVGDGRKVYGNVGDGRASVTVLNQHGKISFIAR